jgi:hypothetical protein
MLIGGSFSVLPCDDRSPSPSAWGIEGGTVVGFGALFVEV